MAGRNQEIVNQFGERVRELRIEKGLSMERLAELAETEYSQIARIESGKINTTISTAYRLAKGLGIELKELFEGIN